MPRHAVALLAWTALLLGHGAAAGTLAQAREEASAGRGWAPPARRQLPLSAPPPPPPHPRPPRCQTCANPIFALPTIKYNNVYYLLAPVGPSVAAYCSRKGYAKPGAVRSGVTGAYTTNATAAARIRVANLATGAVCTGLACSFVRGVECVPAGRAACKADANANVGNSNSGSVREGGCSPAHGSMPEGRRRLAAP